MTPEYYVLIGESNLITRPDIEISTKANTLRDACERAIELMESKKYANRFWGISLFRYGEYKGMVTKSGNSYRYLFKSRYVKLTKDGRFKE